MSYRPLRPDFRRYLDHSRLRQDLRVTADIRDWESRIYGWPGAATQNPENCRVGVQDGEHHRSIELADLPLDAHGYALTAEATFDPPTSPLDENGQGVPYAVFGFGAHLAEIEVDIELGTVKVLKITAAHD